MYAHLYSFLCIDYPGPDLQVPKLQLVTPTKDAGGGSVFVLGAMFVVFIGTHGAECIIFEKMAWLKAEAF